MGAFRGTTTYGSYDPRRSNMDGTASSLFEPVAVGPRNLKKSPDHIIPKGINDDHHRNLKTPADHIQNVDNTATLFEAMAIGPRNVKSPEHIPNYGIIDTRNLISPNQILPDKINGGIYEFFRKDAFDAQKLADDYSNAQKKALAIGDGMSATFYEKKAEEQQNLAKHYHEEAARRTLAYNNHKHDEWTLDLHYLHSREAIGALRTRLHAIESGVYATQPGTGIRDLLAITGRGNHSKGAAVLPSVIRNYLQSNRYAYTDLTGSFLIQPKVRKTMS